MKAKIEVNQERLTWLDTLVLGHGSHADDAKAACVMEAVAYVAGEAWTDRPKCASRAITTLCIRLNDRWDNKRRQQLKPYVLRIAGTANGIDTERRRAFMCADAAVREFLPLAMEKRLPNVANKLRELPEIVDASTARAGQKLASEAHAAYAAAHDAAYAAAADAADAAADAAAYAAADAAAYAADAAAYAAAYADAAAAYAAAADAAYAAGSRFKGDALVLGLLDRLIRLTEVS